MKCPGGSHNKPAEDICCDPCWRRLPAKLEGTHWRRRLIRSRQVRDWNSVSRILDSIEIWLKENPKD